MLINWVGARWGNLRLLGKYATIMSVPILIGIPLAFFVLSALLKPTFADIERKQVADQTERVHHALKAYEEGLQKGVGDYAMWDSSYAYLASPDRAFEAETLVPLTYQGMGADLVAYVRFDGTVVWSKTVDRTIPAYLPEESTHFADLLSKGRFFERARANPSYSAYMKADRGLYRVYSQWQVKSDGSGTPQGFVVMGNLLDAAVISDALQVNAKLTDNVSPALAKSLKADRRHFVFQASNTMVTTHLGLEDLDGGILAQIVFSTPRNVAAAGRTAVWLAGIAMVLAMLAMLAAIGFGIRRIAVRRLQKLEAHVRQFKTNGRQLKPDLLQGADEIASLAREFQVLSEKLGAAEDQLRESAYLQGKADSASGMLHNVRNALAPIRVSQEKWLREETLPFRANMKRAIDELAAIDLDPARKRDLEQFLMSAARKLALISDTRIKEMQEAKASIDQIAAILGTYNFDTSANGAGEIIDLGLLLRQEMRIVDAREGGPVCWDMPTELPMVMGNRVHLGQVIGNLLVNAHEAMVAAAVDEKKLAITCAEDLVTNMITIRLTDNGDGIAPEDISKTFHRGFSTRDHKAGGIGMHWSANTMRAMGGEIALESEGRGKGATAIIVLRGATPASSEIALAA